MNRFDDLLAHAATVKDRHILDLFAADPARATAFSAEFGAWFFDFSKTNIDAAGLKLLIDLAEKTGVAARRDAMFAGEKINETEGRAVLHMAWRNAAEAITVDGHDVMPALRETLGRMQAFAEDVRTGRFTGQGGRITDVVNIGIGGSDLGPVMAAIACSSFADGPRLHFISNVDGAHAHDVLSGLDPETTLVIVASKTFTTIETMTNAQTVRA